MIIYDFNVKIKFFASFTYIYIYLRQQIISYIKVYICFLKNIFMSKILSTLSLLVFCSLSYSQSFNGFALYNAQGENTTYLIDENLNIAHTWTMSTECNYTVLLKDNGNLVRGTKNNTQTGGTNNSLNGAASSGRVQEIDPLGNIVMDFIYSSNDVLSHHDICLIGDNVLLTAWEVKTASEINALGGSVTSDKWPTHFVEVANDGNGGGQIVWEWHIWDHLIQDTDPSKPNYGVISDNPQLIDINMITQGGGGGPGGGGGDWFHVNGVDYNEDLDQIAFSSRFASEIYIIDHSTTTAEAASHSGGVLAVTKATDTSGAGETLSFTIDGNAFSFDVHTNKGIHDTTTDAGLASAVAEYINTQKLAGITATASAGNVTIQKTTVVVTSATDATDGVFTVTKGGALDVTSNAAARASLDSVEAALTVITDARAGLGAVINRLDNAISNLTSVTVNTEMSLSRIKDTDYAQEMSRLTTAQILENATMAMMSQSNASKQDVLQLLQ